MCFGKPNAISDNEFGLGCRSLDFPKSNKELLISQLPHSEEMLHRKVLNYKPCKLM